MAAPLISILHPSRGRAKQSRKTIDLWMNRAVLKDFEILIGIENEETKDYYNEYFPCGDLNHPQIKFIPNDYRTAVNAINSLATFSSGNILIVVSDDTSAPIGWAARILKYTEGKRDFVMKVRDGIQPKMITQPILDRAYFQRDGWIYHPRFKHCFADQFFTDLAHKRKRVITKNILFKHNHYSVSKSKKRDAQYERTDATFNEGREIYKELKKEYGL